MVIPANERDIAEKGMGHTLLTFDPSFTRLSAVLRNAQAGQGQQPAQHIPAHALRGVAQSMLQPGDVAEFLRLQRLGCGVDEPMQFLRPFVYGRMGFFLMSSPPCRASASRTSTNACASFMKWT
jgi:hypothetical protein